MRETATIYPQLLADIFLPEYFNCIESKRPNLQRIPVYIINDDVTVGLYGTASYFLKEKKDILGGSSFWDRLKSKFFSCCC